MNHFIGIVAGVCLTFSADIFVTDLPYGSTGSGALAEGRTHLSAKTDAHYTPEFLAKLENQVRANPADGSGWDKVAPVYLKLQRFGDAAKAYGKAIQFLGEDAGRLMGVGVAEVFSNSGNINNAASDAFEKALNLNSSLHIARYWLAIAKEQDKKFDAAAQAWQEMLQKGSVNAIWRPQAEYCLKAVRAHLQKSKGTTGPDRPSSLCSNGGTRMAGKPLVRQAKAAKQQARRSHAVAQAGKSNASNPNSKEFAAARKAAEEMAPTDRMAMVNQMVDGLAERLKENGEDLEGWVKLVRSYAVLGKRDEALQALSSAAKNFKGDSAAIGTLNLLKQKLKLGS